MNNRKRTRGRKFTYTTASKTVQTKFGPVDVPDETRKVKVITHVAPRKPVRNEGLVFDPKIEKWVKKEELNDTKRESRQ